MVTRKVLDKTIHSFVSELSECGYNPQKVVLFGSYAKGRPNAFSDIDLAVWDSKFTGCGSIDIEPIVSIISRHPGIELHTFSTNDTPENDPMISEIFRTGRVILDRSN
uniref:nucleotidyltransferase domain-containing protein n=1 Tax=Fulvivirga sp. TaxID=1931237 RepID=UPI00404B2270